MRWGSRWARTGPSPDFITADWNTLSTLPGAKRAAALVEIGQLGLADRELKYLAATADPTAYGPLLRLSARLNLPATQYWLAQHPPLGQDTPMSARFPAPDWRPAGGWRVDRSLVFAHALQESNFQTTATSRAGAKGIMQLMPATAKLLTARMADGTEVQVAAMRDLTDPEFNIECGQSYLQSLRDMSYTGGLLPKVVAAYNAGPGSVQKWNTDTARQRRPFAVHRVDPVQGNPPLRRGRAPQLLDVPDARRRRDAEHGRAGEEPVAEVPRDGGPGRRQGRADVRGAADAGLSQPDAPPRRSGGSRVPVDESRTFIPVRIAVLTVSDTRTAADDRSGDTLVERLTTAGHVLAARAIAVDDVPVLVRQLNRWIDDPQIDCIISTGGTGVTGRDVTPEALAQVWDKEIPGFGELFRWLSYQSIGTSTVQSRATAGVARGTYLFALPGSTGAVRDGWDGILSSQLDSRHRPCNFVELMPRLMER